MINNTAQYGSAGRLQGVSVFPLSAFFDGAQQGFSHESGHQWINFLSGTPFAIGTSHWPKGNVAINQTTFNTMEPSLMGLAAPAEVGTFFVLNDQNQNVSAGPTLTAAEITTVTVGAVIAAQGARVPASTTAQKNFRCATVVVPEALHEFFARRCEAKQQVTYAESNNPSPNSRAPDGAVTLKRPAPFRMALVAHPDAVMPRVLDAHRGRGDAVLRTARAIQRGETGCAACGRTAHDFPSARRFEALGPYGNFTRVRDEAGRCGKEKCEAEHFHGGGKMSAVRTLTADYFSATARAAPFQGGEKFEQVGGFLRGEILQRADAAEVRAEVRAACRGKTRRR